MALPTSRNTTYAAGSEVKSADLDDLQDWIIALHDPFNVAPAEGFPEDGVTAASRDSDGFVSSLSTGDSYWSVRIPLREGQVLESIDAFCLEANLAGEEILLQLIEMVNGTGTQKGDTITSGVTGAAATHTWDSVTNDSGGDFPYTVPTNGFLILFITFNQTSVADEAKVYNVRVSPE